LTRCPQARPEFKRLPVVINDKENFCISIYVPYVGRLVETNKGEAWIRYGDSRHKMSEEERRDFRATRHELSFEMDPTAYEWPKDFDLRIVQDFCDAFREREGRKDRNNLEVLIDRHLLRDDENGKIAPLNSLVLMAAVDPRRTIPGCRVRIQRFATMTEGSGQSYSPVRDRIVEGNLVKIIERASQEISDLRAHPKRLESWRGVYSKSP
jgi:ATP-dependent DNA helicase RecG